MHLHSIDRRERDFELGAVHEHARDAEAERPIEAITRAAGENRSACDGVSDATGVRRGDGDRLLLARDTYDASGGPDRGAGRDGGRCEIAIENRAVDDRRANPLYADVDNAAVRRDEARCIGRADNRAPGQVELIEGVEAENSGAVDWRADDVVFFEDANIETRTGQFSRRDESRRPTSDHDHIAVGIS
jgi:hypothetical protein